MIIPVWAKFAAPAIAGAFCSWWVTDLWWSKEYNDREAQYTAADLASSEAARERQAILQNALIGVSEQFERDKAKANDEIDNLRRDVDAGTVRLRIAARCPAPNVSATASGGPVSNAGSPELDPSVRQDYYALRQGLEGIEAENKALKAVLKSERSSQ